MVILDGKHVDPSAIDPTRHRFIGTWRPPSVPAHTDGTLIACPCGQVLNVMGEDFQHWQRGCFDQPQYVTIATTGSVADLVAERDLLKAALGALDWSVVEIKRLRAITDAAEAFLAALPDDMPDAEPYKLYVTAGECRALRRAFQEYLKPTEAGEKPNA